MFLFVFANVLVIPLFFMARRRRRGSPALVRPGHPGWRELDLGAADHRDGRHHVAPWQLFFQQSNIIDKRITPRWINYERSTPGSAP